MLTVQNKSDILVSLVTSRLCHHQTPAARLCVKVKMMVSIALLKHCTSQMNCLAITRYIEHAIAYVAHLHMLSPSPKEVL